MNDNSSDGPSDWKPDDEEALKALIRKTIQSAGPIDPAALPSKIKETLRGRATGDLDVDACIAEAMADAKKKSD